MTLGVQALNPDCLIEIDLAKYQTEIALKQAILTDDYPYYFQALSDSEPQQWEAVELLLPNLARHYPQHFKLTISGQTWFWQNFLLGLEQTFQPGEGESLPFPPLDWLGRQVQEDLLLMDGNQLGIPLVAGQLCFANGWCLDDKMGKSFLAIHHEVPLFAEQIGRSSQLMMERLKADRPAWRVNWAVKPTNRLNLATRFDPEVKVARQGITPENAGERCFFRIERQGFLRLPRTNGVLFTIHTYQTTLSTLTQDEEQARLLLGVLNTTPQTTLEYKGIAPFADAVIAYLKTVC